MLPAVPLTRRNQLSGLQRVSASSSRPSSYIWASSKERAAKPIPDKPAPVASVLLNMESLHKLTAAIEGLGVYSVQNRKAAEGPAIDRLENVSEPLFEAVSEHRRMIQELPDLDGKVAVAALLQRTSDISAVAAGEHSAWCFTNSTYKLE